MVLFDFDGVIRHWRADVTDALDRDMGLEVGTLDRLAHAVPEHDLGVLGKVTFDDWCHAVTRALESVAPPGAAAAAAFGVEPHECVFVDDRAENVQGALRAGMHAEQFRDPSACGAFVDAALRGGTRAGQPGVLPRRGRPGSG